MKETRDAFAAFGAIWLVVIFVVGLATLVKECNHKTNKSPVEESVNIDSLINNNSNIKIKIDNLDSIKNAKVIEVITLDNDSSIKLFYKLVQE